MNTRDLLRSGLRLAGVIAQNEDATDEDVSIATECLSMMLDTWSINPQIVWLRDTLTFNCDPGTTSITLPYRPVKILSATYEVGDTNAVIYKMQEMDEVTFYQTPIRHTGLPRNYMYDHNLTLKLIGASTGVLRLIVQPNILDVSSDLDLDISMPPGYTTAMKYNLGLLLCEEFGKTPSANLNSFAADSLSALKSQNKRPSITRTEVGSAFGLRGRMPIPRANAPQT